MVRRDYQSKNLKNPFFKPARNKKLWRRFILVLITVLLLGAAVFLLFFSPLFVIKKIEIRGAQRTNLIDLENWLWQAINQPRIFNLPPANLFLFSSDTILSSVITEFDLSTLSIQKSYPKTLIINLEERQAAFILDFNNQVQLRDANACPINNASVTEDSYLKYPVIKSDKLSADQLLTCLSLANGYLDDVLTVFNLSQKYQEFSAHYFLLNGDEQTINMIIHSGPTVYLNRRDDLDKQLLKLLAVCRERTNDELAGIEYIDVRYGDKAYIK